MDSIELRQLSRRLNAASRSGGKYFGARAAELAKRLDKMRRSRPESGFRDTWATLYFGPNMHGPDCEYAIKSAIFWRDKAAKGELR